MSGNPVFVTTTMPISLTGGLPRIIPGPLRTLIRSGDLVTIRAVLTMASVYRIIKIDCPLKLSSITDPFKGLSTTLPEYEIKRALARFRNINFGTMTSEISLALSTKAGPNSKVAMQGILMDVLA